jgi:hypothetical protein
MALLLHHSNSVLDGENVLVDSLFGARIRLPAKRNSKIKTPPSAMKRNGGAGTEKRPGLPRGQGNINVVDQRSKSIEDNHVSRR